MLTMSLITGNVSCVMISFTLIGDYISFSIISSKNVLKLTELSSLAWLFPCNSDIIVIGLLGITHQQLGSSSTFLPLELTWFDQQRRGQHHSGSQVIYEDNIENSSSSSSSSPSTTKRAYIGWAGEASSTLGNYLEISPKLAECLGLTQGQQVDFFTGLIPILVFLPI